MKKHLLFVMVMTGLIFGETAFAAKKVLLFYVALGMGTKTAAEGIATDLRQRYPGTEVTLKDVRDFSNPVVKSVAKTSYEIMTRSFPEFFDESYLDYMEQGRKTESLGDLPLFKQFGPQKMLRFIHEVNPDVILSTYHVATEALISFRNAGTLSGIPVGAIHTDLVDETYFAKMALEVDMEFVITPELRESFIRRGVPARRVIASGTPLNPKALSTVEATALEQFRVQNRLIDGVRTVLLTGGSNGVGDYPLIVKRLEEAFHGEPLQIVAICGRNESHYRNLTRMKEGMEHGHSLMVRKLVPQEDMFSFMSLSHLIIGKTGGVTPIELFYRKKPLVLLDVNGGQESYNAGVYLKSGLAKVIKDQSTIGAVVRDLLNDQNRIQAQLEQHEFFCQSQCSWKITDWAMQEPTVQPALNRLIQLDSSPDQAPPSGAFWNCARWLRK